MNRELRRELYREIILSAIPRVLTQLDRDPFSITYGCFDREYWAWATKDFSNIDLQRAIYPLTHSYLNNFDGNIWYRQSRIRDWILAAFNYWAKVQHNDGSFDHHYPSEHSFVGVAFTLYEISQAFVEMYKAGELSEEDRCLWLSVMKKAADFLCLNDELHGFISNHRLGAACALYSMFLITGNEKYKKRAYFFIDSIKNRMSKKEGWLCEYNGADPGYQTLDAYYLAIFYHLSNDESLLQNVIMPSFQFLIYFFHPDGSVGGEYGSRNCPLYFPAGFEILASIIPEAEAIAQIGAKAISAGNSPALMDHDIRNFVPMLSAYTQAFFINNSKKSVLSAQMPFEREFERFWPEAGLFIRSDKKRYFIVGFSKGGVVKVFDKIEKKIIASHCGYMVKSKNKRHYSTQFLNSAGNLIPDCAGKEVALQVKRVVSFRSPLFLVAHTRIMTPFRFLLFRTFNFTIGRIKWFNNLVRHKIITDIFIHRKIMFASRIKRTMIFSENALEAIDDFSDLSLRDKDMKSIRASDFFTIIYMGSSKYYRHSEKIEDKMSKIELYEILKRNKIYSFNIK